MSGIRSNARFAVLDVRNGMDLDTYATEGEMLHAVYYAAAAHCPHPKVDTDAALCDVTLAYVDSVHATVRQQIIHNYDPARLRQPEVWPFCMADSSLRLEPDRWYVFGDGGGTFSGQGVDHVHPDMLVGGGFASLAECRDAYEVEQEQVLSPDDWSSNAEDLGGVLACILTGRMYVDRLYYLTEHDCHEPSLEPYGEWSKQPKSPEWWNQLTAGLRAAEEAGFIVTVENKVRPHDGSRYLEISQRLMRGHY